MQLRDWTFFAILSAAWGTSFLFIKIGLDGYSPPMLAWLRLTIAALLVWAIIASRRLRPQFSPRLIGLLLIAGLVNNAVPFALISWGEQHIDSGLTAILNSAVPLFTLVIAHLALADEHITLRRLVGLALGFAGIVALMAPEVVQSGSDLFGSASLRGQLAILFAGICYATGNTFARRYLRDENPMILAAGQTTAASLWLAPLAFLSGSKFGLFQAPLPATLSILWLGLISTGIAYLLYFWLIVHVGATRTSLTAYVSPIISVILGAIFLRESITWVMLGAMAMILGGVIVVNGPPEFMARRVRLLAGALGMGANR